MKKTNKVITAITSAALILTTAIGAATVTANAAAKAAPAITATAQAAPAKASVSAKDISSKNWMKYIKDDVKLTELNIPGAHDAAMVHSTAVFPVSTFTLTQAYHIGRQTWTNERMFKSSTKVSEDGLLERGVRYLDIRYGLNGGGRKHTDVKNASSKLKLVHGGYTAQYKSSDDMAGFAHYDKTDNEKLMQWLKTFLTENPSETVILDISSDDGDNNPATEAFAYDFFKQQAENPNPNYPQIYVGNHVPTLGEARGKLVLLTSINANHYFGDMGIKGKNSGDYSAYKNGAKIGDFAFKNAYTVGDKKNKTFGLAVKDEANKCAVYKDNYWEDDSRFITNKWEWIKNGLNDAEKIMTKEKNSGIDAFMLNFASSNTVKALSGPKFYAERMIPQITKEIKNGNQNKFYGIVAMDFCDTDNGGRLDKTNFGSTTSSRIIFETNFSRFGINSK